MRGEEAIISRPDDLQDLLQKIVPQLKMVLPRHLTPERLVRIALTAIRNQPKLLQCDKYSILKAVMESAQLGLEPDGLLGHAYLIPYWNSKRKCYEAQLQVGYRGFLDLARRSGQVSHIFAQVVYEKDHFKFTYGTNPSLEHVPAAVADRGEKIAAYAIAYLVDGRTPFEVMYRDQIEKIRDMSKRADEEDSPWSTHEDEMWRKTVIRRLAKYLPLSPELTRAAVLDEYREMGVKADLVDIQPLSAGDREPEVGSKNSRRRTNSPDRSNSKLKDLQARVWELAQKLSYDSNSFTAYVKQKFGAVPAKLSEEQLKELEQEFLKALDGNAQE